MSEQIDTSEHTDLPPVPDGAHRTVSLYSRKSLWLAAGLLFGAMAIGVIGVAVFSHPSSAPITATSGSVPPRSIPLPNSGQKPTHPGDRGGWEQLLVFCLVCLSVTAIFAGATRGGGRRAKEGRDAWKAAGHAGHDGAVG